MVPGRRRGPTYSNRLELKQACPSARAHCELHASAKIILRRDGRNDERMKKETDGPFQIEMMCLWLRANHQTIAFSPRPYGVHRRLDAGNPAATTRLAWRYHQELC